MIDSQFAQWVTVGLSVVQGLVRENFPQEEATKGLEMVNSAGKEPDSDDEPDPNDDAYAEQLNLLYPSKCSYDFNSQSSEIATDVSFSRNPLSLSDSGKMGITATISR